MTFKYLVRCWINPQSGHDLRRKNQILRAFRELLLAEYPEELQLEEALNRFEASHEGKILEHIIVESDAEVIDPEKEILPEILKAYPDATLFSCEPLPNFITSSNNQ